MASAQPPPDELYPAAFRLCRMYAILSPRLLVNELKVDRARADRLLALLAEHGAVGEPIIVQTGARESRVNIVQDEAPKRPEDILIGTDAGLGRRAVAIGAAAAVFGLLLELTLSWLGAGAAVSRWLHAEIGSPIAAAVITSMVPLVGLGIGWLVEVPLRASEELVPGAHLRAHSAIWSLAGVLGVGFVIVRLLS